MNFWEFLKGDRSVQFAILIKIFILFCCPEVVEFFSTRPEVNNPLTSLRHLKEAIFLVRNDVNIYEGGILQPAPWLLALFYPFEAVLTNFYAIRLLFIAIDLLIAFALYELSSIAPVRKGTLTPQQIAKCHLYNPMGWFAVFGMNWGLFLVWLQICSLTLALKGRETVAAVLSGFLVHVDFYNLPLMVPVALCCKHPSKAVLKSVVIWVILTFTSNLILSNINFNLKDMIDSVYISRMRIDSLRPNSGLTWYLFAQAFPAFNSLIKITFQMVLMVFWPACLLKFRSDPMFVFFTLIGSQMILKGYPSAADYALFFALLTTQARLVEHSRVLFVALFVAAGVYVLKMQMWRYWIELPGFNANFYYVFTLIWNAALVIIFMDVVAAYNKTKIYEDNERLKEKEYEKCKLLQR